MLTQEALEARRQYKREWQRRNRDKVQAQQERYWAKKAAAQADRQEPGAQAQTVEAKEE